MSFLVVLAAIVPLGVQAAPSELDDVVVLPLDPSRPAAAILASRPFVVPGDRCPVFCRGAEGSPLDEAGGRERLVAFLTAREVAAADVTRALDRFDAGSTRDIVPDPTLRASLLMLSGWEPYGAIVTAVLDGENPSGLPFAEVVFQPFDNPAVAYLTDTLDGRYALRVNSDFAAEAPETLVNVLVHEALHDPYVNSYEEEVIANVLDGVAYAEVLLVASGLATAGTTLTVYNNFALLALLNSSGAAGPANLGISTSRFGDVWLGPDMDSSDAASLRDAIAGDGVYAGLPRGGSPGQSTLTALLRRFRGVAALGDEPGFDEATLAVIDSGIGKIIPAAAALTLAEILALALAGDVREIDTTSALPTDPETALATRPFLPLEPARFDPSASAAVPTRLETAGSQRAALETRLELIGARPRTQVELLRRFDDPALADRIPSPTLRAAVVLLGALPAGVAVSNALVAGTGDGPWAGQDDVIAFAILPHGLTFSFQPSDRGDSVVVINRALAGESLEVLASVLVEAVVALPVHRSGRQSQDQAVLAAAVGTVTYAAFLLIDPNLATEQTWVINARNRCLLALLNSAPIVPSNSQLGEIGLLNPAEGVADVLPNLYPDARSFEADVLTRPGTTTFVATRRLTAPPLVEAVLTEIGVPPVAVENEPPTFGEVVVGLDARLGAILPPDDLLRLAEALALGLP